ncbi:WD40-repeat-containing domain protein [Pilaira anomala]|nr:WD40-repeat-containing domain protein [Pilaira anomala]
MSFEDLKVILSFPEGKTIVCYKYDGKQLIVGGSDAHGLNIYDTDPDTQDYVAANIVNHTEDVTCIASSKNGYASGGTDGLVLLYNNANSFEKILVRSTVPVRDIAYSPDGTKLAIATDDNDIRVVLIADSSKIVQLKGHKSTVKSVCYDTKGDYIVSSDTQGDILVWSVGVNEPLPKVVKRLSGMTYKASMDSILLTTVVWNPDNTCFAFPGLNNEIRVFSSRMWNPLYSLEGEHSQEVNTMSWSPNGYYLAAASRDNLLVIWDTKTKKKVKSEINTTTVTSIAWSPTVNQLAITDMYGQLRFWNDVIPLDNSNYPHPAIKRQIEEINVNNSRSIEMDEDDVNMLFGLDDDEAEEEIEGEDVEGEGEGEGNFVIDDDGAGYVERATEETGNTRNRNQGLLNVTSRDIVQRQRKLEQAFQIPVSFQPGETPYHKPEDNSSFLPAHGERRYMAFNLVGVISTIFEEDHSVINVEFHDQSEYRNFYFTDVFNFTMAAISTTGTVYAVESQEPKKKKKSNDDDDDEEDADDDEEESKPINSILYYRPNNWGQDKDWTHHMLPGEDVITVAINRVSVIATTSLGYVRIFTTTGIQKYIFSLENIVSVTAKTDLACFIYSNGPGYNNQQNLQYLLLNTDTNEVLQKDHVQLTTDGDLHWVGFTETNQVVTFDSSSVLRVLQDQRRPYQAHWVPVFDGKLHSSQQNKMEKYWPVGVLRDKLMCVILRGNNPYPFFPRPPVRDIPLELPLLDMSTEVGKLEEERLRLETCNRHEQDEAESTNTLQEFEDAFNEAYIGMDVALLKLINLACKSEKILKALDLSNILHTVESLDKAIRIALYHRHNNLAEKMTQIKETKFMKDDTAITNSLADSFSKLPSVYTSNHSTLDGDLSLLSKSTKRDLKTMDIDDERQMKKPRPFQFSS